MTFLRPFPVFRHFYASEPTGPWTPSLEPVVTNHTLLSNGSAATLFTRQRNSIIFDADGVTPRVYLNGASWDEYNNGAKSLEFTLAWEFNTK